MVALGWLAPQPLVCCKLSAQPELFADCFVRMRTECFVRMYASDWDMPALDMWRHGCRWTGCMHWLNIAITCHWRDQMVAVCSRQPQNVQLPCIDRYGGSLFCAQLHKSTSGLMQAVRHSLCGAAHRQTFAASSRHLRLLSVRLLAGTA
jgi:hypothetical protein